MARTAAAISASRRSPADMCTWVFTVRPRGFLLCDAVHVTAAEQDLASGHGDDLAVGEQPLVRQDRVLVVRVVEHRQYDHPLPMNEFTYEPARRSPSTRGCTPGMWSTPAASSAVM